MEPTGGLTVRGAVLQDAQQDGGRPFGETAKVPLLLFDHLFHASLLAHMHQVVRLPVFSVGNAPVHDYFVWTELLATLDG